MTILTRETVLAAFSRNVVSAGEDAVLRVWAAAEGYVAARCSWPTTDDTGAPVPPPADLAQAVELLIRRLLARASSPDGLVQGATEYGPARIASTDRDIERLIAPWRRMVLA